MSEGREERETEPAPTAPFRLICTGCGADIDAPDRYFTLGPMALVPHANHALISVRFEDVRIFQGRQASWLHGGHRHR